MPALRFEGYVIVSGDGMLADAQNVMPDQLKFEGDKRFFTAALDRVALIGGRGVFDMFMDRYDTFWLSVAPKVRLPGGEPCFRGVPMRTPEQILAAHGLKPGKAELLDPEDGVSVTPWRRA